MRRWLSRFTSTYTHSLRSWLLLRCQRPFRTRKLEQDQQQLRWKKAKSNRHSYQFSPKCQRIVSTENLQFWRGLWFSICEEHWAWRWCSIRIHLRNKNRFLRRAFEASLHLPQLSCPLAGRAYCWRPSIRRWTPCRQLQFDLWKLWECDEALRWVSSVWNIFRVGQHGSHRS